MAQRDHRLEVRHLVVAERCHDLVDDTFVENGLDGLHRPEHLALWVGLPQVADHAVAERGLPLEQTGHGSGIGAGPKDEQVSRADPLLADGRQTDPKRPPLDDREDDLAGEQRHQQQPAHLGSMNQEQEAEHRDGQQECGPKDVGDLAPECPARPEVVQLLDPLGRRPQRPVRHGPDPPWLTGSEPRRRPPVSQPEHRHAHEQDHGREGVAQQQGQAEESKPVADHHSLAYRLSLPNSLTDSLAILSRSSLSV